MRGMIRFTARHLFRGEELVKSGIRTLKLEIYADEVRFRQIVEKFPRLNYS
jgi:hypothetical protein